MKLEAEFGHRCEVARVGVVRRGRLGRLAVAAAILLSLISVISQAKTVSCGPPGPNVAVNGGFDTNISSWSSPIGTGSAEWSQENGNGSPGSGSVLLVNDAVPGDEEVSISQCRALPGGIAYDFNAKIAPVNFCCESFPSGGSGNGLKEVQHTGGLYVLFNFYSAPSCGGYPLNESVRFEADGHNGWQTLSQTLQVPASAASVRTTLAIDKDEPGDTLTGNFDDISISVSQPMDPTALCLGSRFQVQAQWTTGDGQTGPAQPVNVTEDTGFFWFFNPSNVEMVVKVLNGCGLNSKFWVFAGGLTDVRVDLTVLDRMTGAMQTYSNPQGTSFFPIQDTSAFSYCSLPTAARASLSVPIGPASRLRHDKAAQPREPVSLGVPARPLTPGGTCVANTMTLCLNKGRFAATAQWTTSDGATGPARVVPVTGESGYFWFFNPDNVEMVVKVLDGCGYNSSYWVFATGLTDLQVVLTITDTQTGAVRTYTNPEGKAFQQIQDTAAFGGCS